MPIQLDKADTAWMLVATALVFLMTLPGLALFYGGLVRKKNVLSLFTQIFASASISTILWVICGYSLSFSDGGSWQNWLGGFDKLMLRGITPDSLSGAIPEMLFLLFQMSFAVITPALITGAFIDRLKFSSCLIFLALWSLFVYYPLAHWVWGGGFLSNLGVLDFAGGTVVHINAGVAGLVLALVVGKRHNYGRENMAPHNLTMSATGAGLLWIGWFGFNAGSALASNGLASLAMLVTQVACAAGAVAWLLAEWSLHRRPSLLGLISGAVAGLVAITPAAGFVDSSAAIIIGLLAGLVCFWSVSKLKSQFGYDDSLDVFGIHGIGGIVGAILTGVFAMSKMGGKVGVIEGNWTQLWLQLLGVAVTILWCGVVSWLLIKFTAILTKGIRVSKETEIGGLDLHVHGEVMP